MPLDDDGAEKIKNSDVIIQPPKSLCGQSTAPVPFTRIYEG